MQSEKVQEKYVVVIQQSQLVGQYPVGKLQPVWLHSVDLLVCLAQEAANH